MFNMMLERDSGLGVVISTIRAELLPRRVPPLNSISGRKRCSGAFTASTAEKADAVRPLFFALLFSELRAA